MTVVRLAYSIAAAPVQSLIDFRGDTKPALLVSYFYIQSFLKKQSEFKYRDWVIDSGAFSAFNSGQEIVLDDYIQFCKEHQCDKTLTEIYALDVIGDYKASLSNTEKMWKHGIEAIPCFHVGSPESELKAIAQDYPKIALGGAALMSDQGAKFKWAEQCFARIWPKKVHGFAFAGERMVMRLPFHSVDACSWELGPCKYGRWRTFGKMSVRGSRQKLQCEIDNYLDLERRAKVRWAEEMQLLESL